MVAVTSRQAEGAPPPPDDAPRRVGRQFRAGDPVVLGWAVEHTFALVGDAQAGAGVDGEDAVPADGSGATPVGVVAG